MTNSRPSKLTTPKIRHESRKRVVGDLGLGGRHLRDECGFPCVGKADEGGICEEFQLESEPLRPSVLPLLGDAGSPVGGVDECGISPATPPALDDLDLLTLFDQVGDNRAFVVDHNGAQRDGQVPTLTGLAMPDITLAMGAMTRGVMGVPLVAEKCRHRGIGSEVHRPARTAISPRSACPWAFPSPSQTRQPPHRRCRRGG